MLFILPGKLRHLQNGLKRNDFLAVSWNMEHTMWHCGQLALLKRIFGKRYDFGLEHPAEKEIIKINASLGRLKE